MVAARNSDADATVASNADLTAINADVVADIAEKYAEIRIGNCNRIDALIISSDIVLPTVASDGNDDAISVSAATQPRNNDVATNGLSTITIAISSTANDVQLLKVSQQLQSTNACTISRNIPSHTRVRILKSPNSAKPKTIDCIDVKPSNASRQTVDPGR